MIMQYFVHVSLNKCQSAWGPNIQNLMSKLGPILNTALIQWDIKIYFLYVNIVTDNNDWLRIDLPYI